MSKTFVLVHGAWHGGWCWRRVADLLEAKGHKVFAPTLTGLGERSHLMRAGINVSTHVTDIVNVLKWERLTDVVLCGHSYGGFVISGVAEQAAAHRRRVEQGDDVEAGARREIAHITAHLAVADDREPDPVGHAASAKNASCSRCMTGCMAAASITIVRLIPLESSESMCRCTSPMA